MDSMIFLRGAMLGFSIAAPVGPIGLLCIRRTLAEGRAAGFVSGLGAATADAIYGLIAGLGLTAATQLLLQFAGSIRLIGVLFLLYLAVRTMIAKPAEQEAQSSASGLARSYASTFLLTITNPMTILSFAAAFSGLGLAAENPTAARAIALVFGVLCGSITWWMMLSFGVGILRHRFDVKRMIWVNHASGLLILCCALAILF
ncbi:MAG: lysine transporter LysE [Acidobacteria bacterium]|nr:MAG: lysine transporter LysE [Acidobacteriota bacterium]